MNKELISVVIPTYNRQIYLLEALESVFAQSYPNIEIIVVDDGSDDQTVEVLQPLVKTKRLRLLRQNHVGVSAARNLGVDKAQAKYIAFLDSDDLFLPEKLTKQMLLFESNPHLGFVHSNFSKFDNHGNDLGIRDLTRFRGKVYPWLLQEWSALMALPTILIRKEVYQEVGGLDKSISWGEDIDLYFRVTRYFEIDLIPEVLTRVRVHSGSVSAGKLGSAESFHRVLEKAVSADSNLSKGFINKAFSKMYVNKSQNLLGEGNSSEMQEARRLAFIALSYRPLEIAAWMAWIASILPIAIRRKLASIVRRIRYPASHSQRL